MISNEQIELITQRLLEKLSLQISVTYLVLGKPVAEVTLPSEARAVCCEDCSNVANVAHVLYYTSSWPSVLRLAELVTKTDEEERVVEALLLAKPVTIYIEAPLPQNQLLQRKLEAALRTLKGYGVAVNEPIKTVQATTAKSETPKLSNKKQLITVDTLMNDYDLAQLSEFKVESNMIVTALAKDYLREHNVTIV